MVQPILTLLVASSIQISSEGLQPADFGQFIVEIAQAIETARPCRTPAEAEITVRDVPFYYDLLAPVPVPAVVPRVTYDWRSPVIFDLP